MNDEFLLRFIKRECSSEEARWVLKWIESAPENRTHFVQLQSIWTAIQMENGSKDYKISSKEIHHLMNRISNRKRWLYGWVITSVAAAFLLFMFSLNKGIKDEDYENALADISQQKEITLVVDKNKQITLADTSAVIAYNKKRQIVINETVAVPEIRKTQLNTVHVPYGKSTILLLADGTKVHLNSGSSLVYPTGFAKNKREVYLEGEAFFEVQKEDEGRKFIVKTAYKEIEVLGTTFNVSVDKTLNIFEAVLVTGSIAVDSEKGKIELTPNQYYGYSAQSGNEEVKEVDVNDYIAWTTGKMKFSKEPLLSVLHKLEKHYNIDITLLKKEYSDYRISGNLNLKNSANETLDKVMRILVTDYNPETQTFYQIQSK